MTQTNEPEESAPRRRVWVITAVLALVIVFLAAAISATVYFTASHSAHPATPSSSSSQTAEAGFPAPPALSAEALAKLPEAKYNAVIGGLLDFTGNASTMKGRYSIAKDLALYGDDHRTPVARLAEKDFLGEPTTVVVSGGDENGWSLVLTPARVSLPSKSNGDAPPQSAAWARTSELKPAAVIPNRIVISVAAQTLTISDGSNPEQSFKVGVGTPDTPTPTNVTGYLQQRYLDPAQDETVYPIQLTSLHAGAQDEPYGGQDGGLIGIHYNPVNSGAVSHGCIRLTANAIQAVNRLPLGTPVTIVP